MFKVLVACFDNWDTFSEGPFILKQGGCIVDVYCSNQSWLISNSYFDNWIESDSDKLTYANTLLKLVENSFYDWIVLADDLVIHLMNNSINNEELFMKIMPLSKIQYRHLLSSKIGLSEFCKANDIITPEFIHLNSFENIDNICSSLKYPLISKLDFSWGGTNISVSENSLDLKKNIDIMNPDQPLLIQEFIKGEEIHIEALFYQGKLLVYQSSKILQHTKSVFSYSTRKLFYYNQDLDPLLITLGDKLGLNGFANIFYIKSQANHQYYLIEVDLRPSSWMVNRRFISKNDFSMGVKKIISGEYIYDYLPPSDTKKSVEMALFYKDIRRAIWSKDIRGIARWIFNIKGYWKFLPFYDPKLSRRIFSEIWKEVFVFKWNKFMGK